MVRQIHRSKNQYPDGSIKERVVWCVPPSHRHPEGFRYRLAFVRPGEEPAVLYDNHHPKGHHKHLRGKEFPYYFESVEKLFEDFEKDVENAEAGL